MGAEETSLIAARFVQLAQEHGAQPAITFRGDERRPDQTFESLMNGACAGLAVWLTSPISLVGLKTRLKLSVKFLEK